MPRVRLTHRPNEEVEVSDKQLIDLQRWGLVVDAEITSAEARARYGFPDPEPAVRPAQTPPTRSRTGRTSTKEATS